MSLLQSRAREAARAELTHRRDARTGLLPFTRYTMPGYMTGHHHERLCNALEAVERGELSRLMVFMPPRHGKSELVSKRFPAWYLGRNPRRQIISASYGQQLADDFGREVRNIIAGPEYRVVFPTVDVASDSAARNRWHTNQGGSYVAAGVGSAITGRGADILNIDDPLKDRAEANSETIRESVWNWYTSTAYTRLMPGGSVILTLTRWHEDDLAGRLLNAQEQGGDQWHVIRMPGLDDGGNALWPERYPRTVLEQIRAAVGPRDWSALYQQDPRPIDGGLFKAERLAVADAVPIGGPVVRAWDLASSAKVGTSDPDWTVGVKMLRTAEGRFVVLDVVRFRGGPEDVQAGILNTAAVDGRSVRVRLPQDPGQAGAAQVLDLTKRLAGYTVASERPTGPKETRAAPFASQVNVGNVALVKASWNAAFIEELRGFPSGRHDDQVDAASDAFAELIAPPRPAKVVPMRF